jgi:hypothetical protein
MCASNFTLCSTTLGEVVPAKTPLVNVYRFVPSKPVDARLVEKATEEAMSRAASP